MHTELQELMSEHVEFSPKPVYSADGDFLSIFVRDSNCYAERVDDTLTIYKDDETDELVGCKLKGVETLLKKLDASGIVIHDEFRMVALFVGWAVANKIRGAESVDILHYLIDRFGNITARYARLDEAMPEHDGSHCRQ